MMEENHINTGANVNAHFVELLLKKIGKKSHAVDIISETLMMDKRTVYRRINSETPFSFSEVLVLSDKFGISLSSLQQNRDETFLRTPISELFNLERNKDITTPGKTFRDLLESIVTEEHSEYFIMTNMLLHGIQIKYPYLKALYRLLTTFRQGSFTKLRNLMEMNTEDKLITRDTISLEQRFTNSIYIYTPSIVDHTIGMIIHFSALKLIDKKNIANIVDELLDALSILEQRASSGVIEGSQHTCNIYIIDTELNINMGCCYSSSSCLSFHRNYLDVFFSDMESTYFEVKKWLENMRALSTLITKSAEIKRINYFKAQKDAVKALISL